VEENADKVAALLLENGASRYARNDAAKPRSMWRKAKKMTKSPLSRKLANMLAMRLHCG